MTTTPTSGAADLPEALKHAEGIESFAEHLPAYGFDSKPLKDAAATIRRLHALLEAEDAAHCNTIEQRDEAEKLGTMLANAVAEHFRVEVGEYSNLNDPRLVALEILGGGYITDSYADRKIAALAAGQATAAQAVVPAGWKLVPEQPTLPMLIKGSDTDTSTSAEDCRRVYRAMLAAAPAQPAAQQGGAYAALPDERAAFEAWYIAQVRSKTSTTNDWSDDEIRGAWLSRPSEEYRSSFAGQSLEAWQARASNWQAPARADPRIVEFKRSFFADSFGQTIPVVIVNFQPNDWDARDAFAASIATISPQAADTQQAPAGAYEDGWKAGYKHGAWADTPPADSVLKDHQIAALVNELRDIAIKYGASQQLRERIAQVVVPAVRAPQADSVLEGAERWMFDAGWKAAARFCDRDDVVADGIIGFGACPQFMAAFKAARAAQKEGE